MFFKLQGPTGTQKMHRPREMVKISLMVRIAVKVIPLYRFTVITYYANILVQVLLLLPKVNLELP
jgi:hypothetical protein